MCVYIYVFYQIMFNIYNLYKLIKSSKQKMKKYRILHFWKASNFHMHDACSGKLSEIFWESPERKREKEATLLIHRGRKVGRKSSAIALYLFYWHYHATQIRISPKAVSKHNIVIAHIIPINMIDHFEFFKKALPTF